MLEYLIERLETPSGLYHFSRTNAIVTVVKLFTLSDELLKEIADLNAQAFAEGV